MSFGGIGSSNTVQSELLIWDSARWKSPAKTASWPPGRVGAAIAFDRRRNRVIMFGGLTKITSSFPTLADTWELRFAPSKPTLCGFPTRINAALGGTQVLSLQAGSRYAKRIYILLGSGSGTGPGFPWGTARVPLNLDFYTLFCLGSPGMPLVNMIGRLDNRGTATAAWTIPPATFPGLKGRTFHHAYVVLDLLGLFVRDASNAVPVELF